MSEWEKFAIASGLRAIIDYRGFTPPKSENGIPLISAANVKAGKLDFSKSSFISSPDYERLATRGFISPGDLIITTEAPAGEVALLPDDRKYQLSRRVMALRADENQWHNKFLFYSLLNPRTKSRLLSANRGTTVPRVLKTDITEFELPRPTLVEQKSIAEVLSSLDDKIDLLKRQNKTLEGMAEALFRQWFIEEAQDDWGEFSASDFVEHIKESEKPQSKPDTWFSHFSLPAFDDGKKPVKEKGETIKSNKYVVQANSLLVSKLNPGTPRIWHCGSTLPQNPICSTEFQVVKPQPHLLGFFRCLYSSKEVVEFLSACASGTSGSHQRVKPKDIIELEFQAPSEDSMMEFSSLTADWFEKILENQAQIFTLENERNTLLPKLMSGEVRIQDTRINE